MLTFSALKEHCAHPALLKLSSPKNYARDKAADKGTVFHAWVEEWVKTGQLPPPTRDADVNLWCEKIMQAWSPPTGCKSEVAIGLDGNGTAWEVSEPEPHVYVREGVDLVTAGRLDLQWYEDDDTCLVVSDIKTGQSYLGDPWSIPQLVAQAVSALRMHNRINGRTVARVKLGPYYARLGTFDWGSGPRESSQVEDMFSRVLAWSTMDKEMPRPGAWCLGCWEKKSCAAFAEMTAA